MNTKEAFATWLMSARKGNGDYYTENTQNSYLTAFCNASAHFPFVWDLNATNIDRLAEILNSDYCLGLPKNRQSELNSSLRLYTEFLRDRQNGWQTITEFSEGKRFVPTSEFSLHVTYDKPFTVKELSSFLQELDMAFKETLLEQGYSRSEANQIDLTVARVSEGSLWFEILSLVAQIAAPVLSFALERLSKKLDRKLRWGTDGEKQIDAHKND